MSFSDQFPWTLGLWRFLTSRPVCVGLLCVVGSIALLAASFHIQAAVYTRRVTAVARVMAGIRLNRTTQADLHRSLPNLQSLPSAGSCAPDVCYYVSVGNLWNGPASNLLEKAGRLGIAFPFYRTLFFLGHRFARFEARFRLRSGVVSEYTYKLQLDDGSFSTPGLLTLDVQGGGDNELRYLSDSFDENPEYQVHSFHKWPDKDLGVRFFPGAAAEQQSHAFQLQLSCMQRSQGCRFAREILPAAYEDMEQISFAARRRLDGQDALSGSYSCGSGEALSQTRHSVGRSDTSE